MSVEATAAIEIGALDPAPSPWRPTRRSKLPCRCSPHGAASIGHYAIRQRGTLGGSLAHADPAAQLPLAALSCSMPSCYCRCVAAGGERPQP